MQPIRIKKSEFVGYISLPALFAWSAGRSPCLLVENRSPEKRRFDEARSRYAAEALSTAKPRFGEFQEFERRFWHEEAPPADA